MAEFVSLTKARRRLEAFLDDVRDGERYVITRRGQPAAALVSIEDLRQIEDAEGGGRRPGGALALAGLWGDVPDSEIDTLLNDLRTSRQ